jgi:hypothetical protein
MSDRLDIMVEGFLKNRTTAVVGEINEYKGRVLAHLREVKASVEDGGWVRGPGVALDVGRLWELADAVRRLQDVAGLDRVVAELPVGKDRIRVGIQPFQGNQYAYVRRFFLDGDGEWRATRKGINLRTELIDDLIALVDRMIETAIAEGVLAGRD